MAYNKSNTAVVNTGGRREASVAVVPAVQGAAVGARVLIGLDACRELAQLPRLTVGLGSLPAAE